MIQWIAETLGLAYREQWALESVVNGFKDLLTGGGARGFIATCMMIMEFFGMMLGGTGVSAWGQELDLADYELVYEDEFEGTELGLASGIGPNMGIVTITIDDNAPITVDDYRGNTNPKDRTIAENLKPGKHTVTIEVTGKNEKSGGYEFEIGAILVG